MITSILQIFLILALWVAVGLIVGIGFGKIAQLGQQAIEEDPHG